MESRTATTTESNKRPRSFSGDFPPITTNHKAPKTHSNHLQINYLARQFQDDLPLVSADDTLPSILRLITDYDGVLHRHESIAGNLGACPLGPILVKRFERLFDGPPKVLKSHGKEGSNVTWLDVVEFAKNKPDQFTLEKTRNGANVCQIHTKQSRVEISEEDYVLIASGMPQRMIPPQPISEDEEKELGTLEILEKNLSHIIQLADQVSARARQLNHRLKNRKNAIVSRRESEASSLATHTHDGATTNPWKDTNGNGTGPAHHTAGGSHSRPHSPPSGFVAVNSRSDAPDDHLVSGSHFMFSNPNTDNVTIINGTSIKGASPATRAELMKKFFTTADNRTRGYATEEDAQPPSNNNNNNSNNNNNTSQNNSSSSSRRPRASDASENAGSYAPVAIPSTPSSLLPQPKANNQYERDDGGPFKIEMVSRMEGLQRGDRILPPCDRCRRLHMDCLKNLTACMGCTKKHAKCSWKEVTLEELQETFPTFSHREQISRSLSELSGAEPTANTHDTGEPSSLPGTATDHNDNNHNSHAPAIADRPASEPQAAARSSPPRRALSDSSGAIGRNGDGVRGRDEQQDANDPLAQAIMDTVDTHRARTAAAAAAATATERDNLGTEIRAQ